MKPRALKTKEKDTAVVFHALGSKDEPVHRRQLRVKESSKTCKLCHSHHSIIFAYENIIFDFIGNQAVFINTLYLRNSFHLSTEKSICNCDPKE